MRDPANQGAEVQPLRDHVAYALRLRVLDLLDTHDRCLRALSEPNIHAVRLAARHLQPVLLVLGYLVPEDRWVARASKQARHVLRSTTALRELQVFRLTLASLKAPPSLKRLLDHAVARQEEARSTLTIRQLRKLDREALIRLAARSWPDASPSADRRALRSAVAARRSRLMERIEALRATDPRTLHRARIALKRYRYLADLFAPYLSSVDATQLDRLDRMQARLGQWHDEWVLADRLLSEATRVPPALHRKCLELATAKAAWCAAEQRRSCAALDRLRTVVKH